MDPTDRPDAGPTAALRRLDQRVVPGLQRGARTVARGLAAPLRLVGRWEERLAGGRPLRFVVRHRRGLTLVAVSIAALGSFVHLQRYPDIRDARRARELAGQEQLIRTPGAATQDRRETDGSGTIGPELGRDVERYRAEREDRLAEVPSGERRLAVVSFAEYVTPEQVLATLPVGVDPLYAQYRIPAEGETPLETEIVGGDLEGSIDRAVEAVIGPILQEIEEVETLLESGTVEDEAFLQDLERRIAELEAVRNLLDSSHRVVFAVVVRADGETLRSLAEADGVRLVDPGPGGLDPDRSSYVGLVPEDGESVTFGG